MPPRRGGGEKGKGSSSEEKDQWVVVVPDSVAESQDEGPTFVKLLHPKTEKGAMFLFSKDNHQVLEVVAFQEEFRSWFIGESVQQDGSLHMVTPVDPLFLVLPYLVKAYESGMYMPIDQLVSDEQYPDCIRLLSCVNPSDLEHISDVKGSGDVRACRYNEERTLEWLKQKVEQVADKLSDSSVRVAGGAQLLTFTHSLKSEQASRDDYLRYACGLVSDYISTDLSKELTQHMGIKLPEKKEVKCTEPPAKKAKLSDIPEAAEDYSKLAVKDDKPKNTKMTAAQRALSKVDKTGMKSISSFFSPKTAAKNKKK
ncbi:ribonuclease H2 subunit B-like [Branchiostoma lanceolatum]|uniref:ribonuclease H2 subunit B-like n=1 Tax=Branchiostoma lanceolatum TaxID=7740 RepID=UPI003454C919